MSKPRAQNMLLTRPWVFGLSSLSLSLMYECIVGITKEKGMSIKNARVSKVSRHRLKNTSVIMYRTVTINTPKIIGIRIIG